MPGDILLVSTYELGHQPLGLALPLGFLRRAGLPCRALDLAVEPLEDEALRCAAMLCISVPMHTALRLGVAVARRARALNPSAHVCFFGLYAPLNERFLREAGLADSVLGGEGEGALVELARAVLSESVSSLGDQTEAVLLERLDFALPCRAPLPTLDRYARLERDGQLHVAGYTEASRGCLHGCRHCPIPPVYGGRFFVIPVERVLADVAQQVAAGARHVTLGDPDFFNGPSHGMKVARALHAAYPALTFDVTIKIEHILEHRRHLPELGALGCAFIVTAAESLSPTVLAVLDKGHTPEDLDAAVDLAREAGIALRPTFVPFTPWSTRQDLVALVDWIERRDLIHSVDPIQLAIRLLIPPGSALLELPDARRDAWLGPLDPERLTYRWTHPDPAMDELHAQIAALVERGARDGYEPLALHDQIARLVRGRPIGISPHLPRAPRLTEAWFC